MDREEQADKIVELHIEVLREILRGWSYPDIKHKYAKKFQFLNYEDIVIHKAHRLTFDNEGDLVGAYPVSPLPTPHRITVAGIGTGYAMCAIDALGAAHTFNATVSIESRTSISGKPVRITISPSEPPAISDQVVAYNQMDYTSLQELVAANSQLAIDACPAINFYDKVDEVPDTLTVLDFSAAVNEAKSIFSREGIKQHILNSMAK